jgi:NADH dehydrogenase FAD-containing subunit
MPESQKERRVVIVGAGFAGFNAAQELSRLMGPTTEIVVINETDYFLYLPLMPQVAGGAAGAAAHLSRCPVGCARCGSCSAQWIMSTPGRRW